MWSTMVCLTYKDEISCFAQNRSVMKSILSLWNPLFKPAWAAAARLYFRPNPSNHFHGILCSHHGRLQCSATPGTCPSGGTNDTGGGDVIDMVAMNK